MATVCEWFGLKTNRTVFTGLASKPVATVSGGLASKPATTISSCLASKPAATFSGGLSSKPAVMVSGGLASKPVVTVSVGLASKPAMTVFSSLVSKLVATVSPGLTSIPVVGFLVEPQNQAGGGFSGLGLKTGSSGLVIWASKSQRWFLGLGLKTIQASVCRLRHKNRRREVSVEHASRSSGLLRVEASLARVFQSGLKTGGGATSDPATIPLPFLMYYALGA
jgi:hypothetical protein